ncbi:MAG TPA: hypothetical protein VHP33_29780 [Polyangiaceae bacterium]|nr:hypothetical protein [Polyangiaceae bacterium]
MPEEVVVATKPNLLRRRAIEGSVGMLAGLVIACLNGPWLVSKLYRPLSGNADVCGQPVTEALSYFVKLQLISGLIGSSFILLVSFLFRRMLRKRKEARTAPT